MLSHPSRQFPCLERVKEEGEGGRGGREGERERGRGRLACDGRQRRRRGHTGGACRTGTQQRHTGEAHGSEGGRDGLTIVLELHRLHPVAASEAVGGAGGAGGLEDHLHVLRTVAQRHPRMPKRASEIAVGAKCGDVLQSFEPRLVDDPRV